MLTLDVDILLTICYNSYNKLTIRVEERRYMGLIRVSDDAEKRIKEMANGRTVTATVDALLAGGGDSSKLLKNYLEEKFSHLESLIEDTTVDRLDGGVRRGPKIYSNLCWAGCMQDVYFDFPETEPIWLPGVYQGWAESNMMDEAKFLVKDDVIWVDFFGTQTPALRITPALRSYLKAKGFEV